MVQYDVSEFSLKKIILSSYRYTLLSLLRRTSQRLISLNKYSLQYSLIFRSFSTIPTQRLSQIRLCCVRLGQVFLYFCIFLHGTGRDWTDIWAISVTLVIEFMHTILCIAIIESIPDGRWSYINSVIFNTRPQCQQLLVTTYENT